MLAMDLTGEKVAHIRDLRMTRLENEEGTTRSLIHPIVSPGRGLGGRESTLKMSENGCPSFESMEKGVGCKRGGWAALGVRLVRSGRMLMSKRSKWWGIGRAQCVRFIHWPCRVGGGHVKTLNLRVSIVEGLPGQYQCQWKVTSGDVGDVNGQLEDVPLQGLVFAL
jgi:hypothetical protein